MNRRVITITFTVTCTTESDTTVGIYDREVEEFRQRLLSIPGVEVEFGSVEDPYLSERLRSIHGHCYNEDCEGGQNCRCLCHDCVPGQRSEGCRRSTPP